MYYTLSAMTTGELYDLQLHVHLWLFLHFQPAKCLMLSKCHMIVSTKYFAVPNQNMFCNSWQGKVIFEWNEAPEATDLALWELEGFSNNFYQDSHLSKIIECKKNIKERNKNIEKLLKQNKCLYSSKDSFFTQLYFHL